MGCGKGSFVAVCASTASGNHHHDTTAATAFQDGNNVCWKLSAALHGAPSRWIPGVGRIRTMALSTC
eukprot:2986852-Rhodomonas_salina.3